jgi:hypothetical protein
MNYLSKLDLKSKVEQLAEEAFHQRLISGYGGGKYSDHYQIVYQGKPRHLSHEQAYLFLKDLLSQQYPISLLN